MAAEPLKRDVNGAPVAGAVTNDSNLEVRNLRLDPTTNALIVAASGGSGGTVSLVPATSGGVSSYTNIDLSTTGQVVKNTPGQVYDYFLSNAASSARFFKFYDKATAPTGADTPLRTLLIPPASAANVSFPDGLVFAAGIAVRATQLVAIADATAPSTNDCVINLGYK